MESKFNLESLSPNLIVSDVNKTVDYYSKNLGFQLLARVPETGHCNWAMIMRDGVTLMFQSLESIKEDLPSLEIKSKGSLGTFYIKVKNLDAMLKAVEGKVDIAVSLRTTFYGAREFAIKDPDGYFMMFAEDVK